MTPLPLYLMDAHAIYWRRLGSPKLSKPAAGVFREGIAGKAMIIVHHVAIAEVFYVLQKHGQIRPFRTDAPGFSDFSVLPHRANRPDRPGATGEHARDPRNARPLASDRDETSRRHHRDSRSDNSGVTTSEVAMVIKPIEHEVSLCSEIPRDQAGRIASSPSA